MTGMPAANIVTGMALTEGSSIIAPMYPNAAILPGVGRKAIDVENGTGIRSSESNGFSISIVNSTSGAKSNAVPLSVIISIIIFLCFCTVDILLVFRFLFSRIMILLQLSAC